MSERILSTQRDRIDGKIRIGSTLRDARNQHKEPVWWQLDERHEAALSPLADPHVLAHFFQMMRDGGTTRVEGEVSATLLANLEELNAIWVRWIPKRYKPIRIEPDGVALDKASGDNGHLVNGHVGRPEAISSFSGGLDSCFTLWRHVNNDTALPEDLPPLWRRKRITAALFCHGFDIPLADHEGFELSVHNNARILDPIGIEQVVIASNYRSQFGHDWEHEFAAAVSAAMQLLGGRFADGLIAGGNTYMEMRSKFGSTPMTDPLLSGRVRIVPDGCDCSRYEKCRGMMKWAEALRYVRVCWEGERRDRNCGRCEKCIRTILAFRIAGCDNPPCFDRSVTDDELLNMSIEPSHLRSMHMLIKAAQEHGQGNASWVKALRKAVHRAERRHAGGWVKYLRQQLALGSNLKRALGR